MPKQLREVNTYTCVIVPSVSSVSACSSRANKVQNRNRGSPICPSPINMLLRLLTVTINEQCASLFCFRVAFQPTHI